VETAVGKPVRLAAVAADVAPKREIARTKLVQVEVFKEAKIL
jgi:hypothetical protein